MTENVWDRQLPLLTKALLFFMAFAVDCMQCKLLKCVRKI